MTPQEAIELVEQCGLNVEGIKNIECESIIIPALEKQIPKKPKIHGYRDGREINTTSYTCPVCNKHIGRDEYCKHCGQALDWSDTE